MVSVTTPRKKLTIIDSCYSPARYSRMGGGSVDHGSTYSPFIAFIYVFNLVVGTGALALPSVLTSGGWYLGAIFLFLVACLSFIGVTYMMEAMAAANALLFLDHKVVEDGEGNGESGALMTVSHESNGQSSGGAAHPPFEIVKRTELGQMAEMFFSHWGRLFFYIALILYLFGDAAIYCTFVPRSLVGFAYGDNPPVWAFDVFLGLFVLLIVPFCFFDFQKTKLLQMATMGIRNAALFTIIFLAIRSVVREGPRAEKVPKFELQALPNLFGGAVYAFMCHHSLPGIITPMREKSNIPIVIGSAFAGIFVIYLLLFLACGAAFGLNAEDPITFNFPPEKYGWVGDLLFLFPVFTLSSNFPMLSITLRNNLDTLLQLLGKNTPLTVKPKEHVDEDVPPSALPILDRAAVRRIWMTILAVGPPIVCCVVAEHSGLDVNSLVGITGAYAGAAVMFIIPACLVHCSRKVIAQEYRLSADFNHLPYESHPQNIHASPFKGRFWVYTLIVAAILAIAFITFEKFTTH